jgi:hypothetical protein
MATYYAGIHSVNSGNNTGWVFSWPPWRIWYAGLHSTDSGNNSGWQFTTPYKMVPDPLTFGVSNLLIQGFISNGGGERG